MSIKSIPVCNIANRYKTYEIRRKFPKDFRGWVYIYCTKAEPILSKNLNGMIVGKFYVDDIIDMIKWDYNSAYNSKDEIFYNILDKGCIDTTFLQKYASKTKSLWAIHISKLEIFDKPKTLANFNLIRAPQSWQYIYE